MRRNFSDAELLAQNQEYVEAGGEPFDFSPLGATEADKNRLTELGAIWWGDRQFNPFRKGGQEYEGHPINQKASH